MGCTTRKHGNMDTLHYHDLLSRISFSMAMKPWAKNWGRIKALPLGHIFDWPGTLDSRITSMQYIPRNRRNPWRHRNQWIMATQYTPNVSTVTWIVAKPGVYICYHGVAAIQVSQSTNAIHIMQSSNLCIALSPWYKLRWRNGSPFMRPPKNSTSLFFQNSPLRKYLCMNLNSLVYENCKRNICNLIECLSASGMFQWNRENCVN